MPIEGSKRFYITTPIYYVNAQPHIGHAYTTIAADVLARFHRMLGEEVLYLTGTDEHGQKNLEAARRAGMPPQEHADQKAAEFRKLFEQMHCSFDRFIRTTEPEHVRVVQEVFARLRASGDIYRGHYEGWYCMACETYFLEKDLVAGRCPDCSRPVSRTQTEAYFFRTSAYKDRLLRVIEERPEFIGPESRRNEVLAFIRQGLQDACVSRAASEWDIPVPGDASQTIYVWLDALVNYLTAAGYLQDESRMAKWWPPQVQLMAKDILVRFHATIWPAMLMALGLELPERVFAHGYWLTGEDPDTSQGLRKISKSAGDLVDPRETARQIADASGCHMDVAVDAVRYFVMREVTFGLDGVFKTGAVVQRFNDDLANDLGNLLNRTLPLVERFLGGVVPPPGPDGNGLARKIMQAASNAHAALLKLDYSGALDAIWGLIGTVNRYIDERAPWDLHRAGRTAELQATLYDTLDSLRTIALLVSPFMPYVAGEIWKQLGLGGGAAQGRWEECAPGRMPQGIRIARGQPIFPRIDFQRVRRRTDEGQSKLAVRGDKMTSPPVSGVAAELTIEEFARLDLRVGQVTAARRVQGKDRLLELTVTLGDETRTVVAGIAQQFPPEELVGKQVVLVANLKPATIGGVRSHGMILAAGEQEPVAIVTLDRPCPPGTKVR